jgi:hypothetical protein
MNWLRRLFTFGRLERPPAEQQAGRVLPPASVQRSHLGVQEVDLPAGVVRLRSGEVRAILRVSCLPLHHYSQEEAHAFLVRWAAALNAMPPDMAWLMRSRPSGLARDIRAKRDQAAALAVRAPGSGLAKLAADQLAHLRTMENAGTTRQSDCYVAVRNVRGDIRVLMEMAAATAVRLREAGLRVEPLKDRALAYAIADSWIPGLPMHWVWEYTEEWHLVYSPGRARVVRPRYLDEAAPRQARPPALPARGAPLRRQLPPDTPGSGDGRKALPR